MKIFLNLINTSVQGLNNYPDLYISRVLSAATKTDVRVVDVRSDTPEVSRQVTLLITFECKSPYRPVKTVTHQTLLAGVKRRSKIIFSFSLEGIDCCPPGGASVPVNNHIVEDKLFAENCRWKLRQLTV